jgi:phosphoglycerol transferase MdoB-like AlkP superfamily enzyme
LSVKNFTEVIVSILQDNSFMIYLEQSIFPRILHKMTEGGNYDAIDGAINHLSNDNIIKDNSLFFFIHQMMPHPPYVTENCESIFGTGNVYVDHKHRDYYNSSISCLNKKIKKLVKFIDEKDKDAIVVVQGDHGSRFKENNTNKFADISNEYFVERFSNFSAFRLPEYCNQYLYDSIGTVNSVRLVVACASGVAPKLIDDKNFYAAYKRENDTFGKVIDVSDTVKL